VKNHPTASNEEETNENSSHPEGAAQTRGVNDNDPNDPNVAINRSISK
jgi:hypothetical protein